MTAQQDTLARLDQLLMRVLDGEATVEERRELLSLPDSQVQLAELRGLSGVLLDAVRAAAGDTPELADPVLQALGRDEGWSAISAAMRSVVAHPVDVADGVMAALALADPVDAAFSELRALAAEPVDVTDVVMAAILGDAPAEAPVAAADKLDQATTEAWISALHDGELPVEERLRIAAELPSDRAALSELTAYAELGRLVKTALKARTRKADLGPVWAAVAEGIGLEGPEHVPGWEPVGAAVRVAVAERAAQTAGEQIELADAVMAALPLPRATVAELNLDGEPQPQSDSASVPWWQSMWAPAVLMAGAALALLLALQGGTDVMPSPGADPGGDRASEEAFELASVNDAELEEFETADGVMLHVLQAGDGGPMILMLEELPNDQQLEDEGWDAIEWEEI